MADEIQVIFHCFISLVFYYLLTFNQEKENIIRNLNKQLEIKNSVITEHPKKSSKSDSVEKKFLQPQATNLFNNLNSQNSSIKDSATFHNIRERSNMNPSDIH